MRATAPLLGAPRPEVYAMWRRFDVSGVSGPGLVAWVTRYPSGKCSLAWHCSPVRSMTFYDDLAEIEQVHGHGGSTELIRIYPGNP